MRGSGAPVSVSRTAPGDQSDKRDPAAQPRPAVFIDRDGTIIRDLHYLNDPELVELIPGAAAAMSRLRAAGFAVVVVTNQSGIARGLMTVGDYERVRARVEWLMAAAGGRLDATYMCPHHPAITGPCDCRKPGSALFSRAATDMGLDLRRSVLLGDRWRDIAPAPVLGARGLLIPGPETPAADLDRAVREADVAPTLATAVDRILGG
jgi:histidinol-phosphate phosphatase family protein